MFDMSAQARRHYQLNRTIRYMDHKGRAILAEEGTMFWWNHHRFVEVGTSYDRLEPIEISRAKLYAAGAKMVPFRDGKPLVLAEEEVDITPMAEPERLQFKGKTAVF